MASPDPIYTETSQADTGSEGGDLLDTAAAGPTAIRGSFLRTVGYVAGVGLSVVSAPLLIRHLGFDLYGRYVTVISLVTIVQGVTDVGLGQIGVREFATRSGEDAQRLMRNLLGLRIALTSLGVLIALAFAGGVGYAREILLGTLLAGMAMVLTVVQGTFAVPLAARLELGWVTALELLRQVLTVAGIVALVIAGATLIPFLAISIPVALIVLIATVVAIGGAAPLRPSFERHEWAALLRAVLPFAAAVALGTVYLRITVVLMSLLSSEAQTGYYGTSFTVISVLIALPALTVGSTLPVLARAARDDEQRLNYVLQRLFEVTLIIGAGLAVCFVLGAGFVIEVLAKKSTVPAVDVLKIQSIALVTQFVASAWQYGLLSLHRHRSLLIISIVSLAISVALTFALVPVLQARGAAIAFSAAEVGLAAGSYLLLKASFSELRLSIRVPTRVLLAAGLAFAVLLAPGMSSLARAVVGSAIYVAALVALRAIPAELIDALPGRALLTRH
jgi:O-antigen/teichoic acid export membrane protein